MLTILTVVMPVFLIVGAGYFAAWRDWLPATAHGILMKFAQNYAVPCLLFLALYRMDFGAVFDIELIFSFYAGAITAFTLAVLASRHIFGRRPGESIAFGFGALYSNAVLLGLPITERAYGLDALGPNYLLIAIHAPICYFIGITWMEISRADGRSAAATARVTFIAMFRNLVTLSCFVGIAFNLLALPVPDFLIQPMDMMARAALPTALFALGGVLSQYRIRSALGEAAVIAALSLILHPAIAYTLTHHVFDLDMAFVRSATVMAAMAPGVNAYVFASMYQRAQGEMATLVILATGASVVSVTVWLLILGGAAI